MKIAILDDDPVALELVKQTLLDADAEWWESTPECVFFASGQEMLEEVKANPYDVVLLDRFVPDMSGDVILQWLRQYGESVHGKYTVVIMITSMQSKQNELYALKVGADDYMAKPFSSEKLILRINRLLRLREGHQVRTIVKSENGDKSIQVNVANVKHMHGYTFHEQINTVILNDGQTVTLDKIEFKLAKYIFDNLNSPIARNTIFEKVLNHDGTGLRVVDAYLHRICMKLKLNVTNGFTFTTIHGYGFRLNFEPPSKGKYYMPNRLPEGKFV